MPCSRTSTRRSRSPTARCRRASRARISAKASRTTWKSARRRLPVAEYLGTGDPGFPRYPLLAGRRGEVGLGGGHGVRRVGMPRQRFFPGLEFLAQRGKAFRLALAEIGAFALVLCEVEQEFVALYGQVFPVPRTHRL